MVEVEKAIELRKALDPRIRTVAVFVDEKPEEIVKIVESGAVSIVQLHGAEDNAFIEGLRARLPEGTEIWKAFKVRSTEDVKRAEASPADRVLLDNGYGTGECFDHSLIEGSICRSYMLAGGLTPENIPEVIRRCKPELVDVSSGVETDRFKDREKILKAVQAAHNAI